MAGPRKDPQSPLWMLKSGLKGDFRQEKKYASQLNHANYTICKVHALSSMEWCDVRQINKSFEEKLVGNGSFQQRLILLFTFTSLETERVHAAA